MLYRKNKQVHLNGQRKMTIWIPAKLIMLKCLSAWHGVDEDHIGNKCAIVCFNVLKFCMYYNVLPNKLTHEEVTG